MSLDPTPDNSSVSRRALLGGAGAVATAGLLTACSTDGGSGGTVAPEATSTAPPGPDATPVAAVADVPVGGALFLESDRLVLTQPAAGDFHAFVAICTHQGCNITDVEGDRIVCRCHGSVFDLDGVPVEGPARKPLKSRPVEARGTDLVVG